MGLRGHRRAGRHSAGRWIVAALGLGVLVAALVAAAGPTRQAREFRRVAACRAGGTECFAGVPATIRGRDAYTTTDSNSDGAGTTVHYEVTWEEPGGGRQTREVSGDLYGHAEDGAPATLRRWRGEVVALETGGATEWFLPHAGKMLWLWLFLAWFGLGVALWGLLLGGWDGFFLLGYRTLCWMFISIVPVAVTADALTFGLHVGATFVAELVFGGLAAATAGWMLVSTFKRW